MQAAKKDGPLVFGVGVVSLLLMVGCLSPVQDPRAQTPLTAGEALRLEELRDAAERVRVAYGAGCLANPCAPRIVIEVQMEAVAMWDGAGFRILLQRRALSPGVEPRPAVAHELSHWLLGHTRDYCALRAFLCESEANAEAVAVLVAGWGVSREEAVSLVYASLLTALSRSKPLPGHDTPCRELSAFARTFYRSLPPCVDTTR